MLVPRSTPQFRWRCLFGAAALLLAAPTLRAQVAPDSAARKDSIRSIDAIRVRAPYAPRVIGSASAVTIAPDAIPLGAVAPTMGDVLRRLPFVYVRQNSRGESEISVRGSESRQAALFFEGVPLTLTWDARADVSALPMAGVRQIEYVRGLSSLRAGPNAIGGVVSARLWEDHDPARAPEAVRRLDLQGDQFGGARSSLVLGRALRHSPTSTLQYRVGAGWRDLPGLARPAGVNEPSGNETLRLNTDSRAADVFAGIRYENADARYLSAFATVTSGARGIAPELHLNAPRRWRNPEVSRRIASVSAGSGALRSRLGVGDVEASISLNDGAVGINSYADAGYTDVIATERGEDRTTTLRLTFDQQLGQRVVLRGALTESSIRYLETINAAPSARYRQRLSSVAGEFDVTPLRNVTLSAGLSHDVAVTDEAGGRPPLGRQDGLGWRTGVNWLVPAQGLRFHASASERKRFPALRELYSGSLNRFEPNPGLRPETARTAEFGASIVRGRADVQAVVFTQHIDDAVVRVTLPSSRFQRINRDRFRSTGIELTAGTTIGAASFRGDLTLQRARLSDATITDPSLRRPEDVPERFASVLAVVPFSQRWEAQFRARAVGATRCTNPDSGTLDTQPGAQIADVGLQRSWTTRRVGKVRAAVNVDNTFDRTLYDKCGLPQAGRTLRLGLTIG